MRTSTPARSTLASFIGDFYANISSELVGITITVLIIDGLNRRRDEKASIAHEREQLTRQLGSNVNEVARRAAEELRAYGWLIDGTLQELDLRVANLEEAKLWDADLQGANLQWAKLKKANLNGAGLAGVESDAGEFTSGAAARGRFARRDFVRGEVTAGRFS